MRVIYYISHLALLLYANRGTSLTARLGTWQLERLCWLLLTLIGTFKAFPYEITATMVKGSDLIGRRAQQIRTIVIGKHVARNPVRTVAAEIETVEPVGDGIARMVTLVHLPFPDFIFIVAVREVEPIDALRSVDPASGGTAGVFRGGGCENSGGRERQRGEEELGELHFCPWSLRLVLVRGGNKQFEAQGRESYLLQIPIRGWRRPGNPRAGRFFFPLRRIYKSCLCLARLRLGISRGPEAQVSAPMITEYRRNCQRSAGEKPDRFSHCWTLIGLLELHGDLNLIWRARIGELRAVEKTALKLQTLDPKSASPRHRSDGFRARDLK